MGAITDFSAALNRGTGGSSGAPETIRFYKSPRVNGAAAAATVAGRWTSLWRYEGNPSHGSLIGTTAGVPDNTTAGSLKQTDAGGGLTKWLTGGYVAGSALGTVLLYDRLLHVSGLSGTNTGQQTVGGTLTRYTGSEAAGNDAFTEINTQIGSTATTGTLQYTDQGGTTSVVSPTFAIGGTGLREAERMIYMPTASGDNGLRGVDNIDLLATTGTAGDVGVVIARPLAYAEICVIGVGARFELFTADARPVEIKPGACLAFAWLANSTTAPELKGLLNFIDA